MELEPVPQGGANPAPSALLDVFHQIAVEPVSAEGVTIRARDGAEYLDFYGGHAVALLGHSHPTLVRTLHEQASRLFFQTNAVPLEVRERAASKLIAFGPVGLTQVMFVNSGAEANENALRIAFLATRRQRVVCVEGGFHGRTAGAAAVTDGHATWYAFPNEPFPTTTVPFDDVGALVSSMGEDVAAVIVEPVQGMAGARTCSAEFLRTARQLTRDCCSTLIFDEVQCGMGRTGYPFAAQAFGVTPDLLTTAKGLAGGFPVGAVLVSERLAAAVRKGDLGTTFGAGPLACALVEAVVDQVDHDLLAHVRAMSERIRSTCRVGPVTDVQGMGLLLGLRTSRPASEVLAALRARHILAGSSGDPHVVRLIPPLILQESHVDALASALSEIDP